MVEGSRRPTTTVVVMGVSGSGKTTIAEELVARLGWDFAEGDDFHPPENVAKMRAGHPLTDEDRWPWLATIARWIGEHEAAGLNAVVTCSALMRAYRDLLRDGHPSVWFAEVDVSPEVLRERLGGRKGHYMPASLLESQLAILESLGPDEPGEIVPGDGPPDEVVEHLIAHLRREGRLPARVLEEER
jgi:gluconokinase